VVIAAAPVLTPTPGSMTYTVEPFDYDGTMGITMTVTQDQFGGKMCPCTKIPYPADGSAADNQKGADAIQAATKYMHPNDIIMGFSLGVQVISLWLSQHTPPPGVHILLAGDTWARNLQLLGTANTNTATPNATGQGIPLNIGTDVTMVVNEYDGWSDSPDLTNSPNYSLAMSNAYQGTNRLHYYALADLANPANLVTRAGNITMVLIPTQNLPNNDWMRSGPGPNPSVDPIDAQQRPLINSAYSRPASTAAQQAAAGAEQVPLPNPAWAQNPEPVVAP
jgi:hypothetical protein